MQGRTRSFASSSVLVAAVLLVACGGTAAETTSAPATTPPPGSTAPGSAGETVMERWASHLSPGACFDDVWTADGDFDFSTPPPVVDCAVPHDNEVISIVTIDADEDAPFPADADAMLDGACSADWEAFSGRGIGDGPLQHFFVGPDEVDWNGGARVVVCAAYENGPMTGTARSGTLTAPGEMLVYLAEIDVVDLWTAPGDGGGASNLTGDEYVELHGRASWSPDGTMIAYSVEIDGNADIYVIGADGTGRTRLTDDPGIDDTPVWSPDGTRIAFISDRANGEFDIFTMAADGSDVRKITSNPDRDSSPDWHPDGTRIAYRGRVGGNSDVYVTNATGGVTVNLTTDPGFDGDPTWSPDGSMIAFTSDRTGDYEIFVMDADGSNQVDLTNHPADDEFPTWSSDGTIIAFHSDRHYSLAVWLMRSDGAQATRFTDVAPAGYPRFRP